MDSDYQNIPISSLSLLSQVWAMEVSRRCTSLLNSQDGGILTVSFWGDQKQLPLLFSCCLVLISVPLALLKSSHLWESADSLRYKEDIRLRMMPIVTYIPHWPAVSGDLGTPPVPICRPPTVQKPELRIPFLSGLEFNSLYSITHLICLFSRCPCANGTGQVILCRISFSIISKARPRS